MSDRTCRFFQKHSGLLRYLVFGALTTLVNFLIYFPCYNLLALGAAVSNALAWAVSVAFAFVVNKLFVFDSKSWAVETVLPEIWKFVSARIFSGVLETGLLFIFVTLLHMNDSVIKIAAGIIVVILNYVMSKLLIFKKKKKDG